MKRRRDLSVAGCSRLLLCWQRGVGVDGGAREGKTAIYRRPRAGLCGHQTPAGPARDLPLPVSTSAAASFDPPAWWHETTNPSSLALHPRRPLLLYSVGEVASFAGEEGGRG